MSIRIVLADDHSIVRHGIKAVIERLSRDIEIVGEASNGRELLDLARTRAVDVFVVDISMPVMNGTDAIERLLRDQPSTRAIVLSMYNDRETVQQVFRIGAKGYILKESSSEEIVAAIHDVYGGKYYLSSAISGFLVEGFLSRRDHDDRPNAEASLTPRQREILMYVCEGRTEKEIARVLRISPSTVHVHKNNIMKLLDIHSTAGLVKYGIRIGIVGL